MFSLWKLCLHYYPVGDDWFPSFPSENQVPPQKVHPIARPPPPSDISWIVIVFFFQSNRVKWMLYMTTFYVNNRPPKSINQIPCRVRFQ